MLAHCGANPDNTMLFLSPQWKKEAKLLDKAAQKFVHYKRDLLKQDRITEITARRNDLKAAVQSNNKTAAEEASDMLESTCEKALPRQKKTSALAENVEVFFVAIVIALGLRTYYLQPFRIPTGSMQPTLNGIVGEANYDKDYETPNLFQQTWDRVAGGKSHHKVVSPVDDEIVSLEQVQFLHFFTRTRIHLKNNKPISVAGSISSLKGMGLKENLNLPSGVDIHQTGRNQAVFGSLQLLSNGQKSFEKYNKAVSITSGQVLAQGSTKTGDLVLVDKFSYHFRKPTRGEVFVFDTQNIVGIHGTTHNKEQEAGSHYIKRLGAVPGDTIYVDAPNIYINGTLPQEESFQMVMSQEDGLHGYTMTGSRIPTINAPRQLINKPATGKSEYFALGDNSRNSSDSRDWGTVKEDNLVGPAFFALWPIDTGHWGFIN